MGSAIVCVVKSNLILQMFVLHLQIVYEHGLELSGELVDWTK